MKNKKENNRKIYMIFFATMVVLYGAGYLFGKLAAKAEDSGNFEEILASVKNSLITVIPPLYIALAIISLIIVFVLYMSCKKMYKRLQENPGDDDLWDRLEDKLNGPMILVNIMQIANTFFFGCILCIAEFAYYGKDGGFETAIIIIE